MSSKNKIGDGSRVAIIGGGPAGSFFALYLLHYAAKAGVFPSITIYQERNFARLGPAGCKGCAGILSMSLLKNLDELGLTIPEHVIQSKIEHYTIHSPYTTISISNPEKGVTIASVYRGGGPRISHYGSPISFDGWLLDQAEERGVRVEEQRISRLHIGEKTAVEVAGEKLDYDLIVLAAGINTKVMPIAGHKYIPPEVRIMAQDELHAGEDEVKTSLGDSAHVFLLPRSGIIFGSLVPKGPFINVSVLGDGKHPVSVAEFLNYDLVRKVLPEKYERSCGCRPRAMVGAAGNYYADGFVAVGDAAVTRLYKDGIGSSLLTARQAAGIAIHRGTSRRDFARYYQSFCRRIERDNKWGRFLFRTNDGVKNSRVFLLTQQRLIGDEQSNLKGTQPFTKAAWGMFTGSYSYRHIARMTLSPLSLAKLIAATFWEWSRNMFRRGADRPRNLVVGPRKVLILGSGFGGTYVMRRLVPSLNRNENVETTMVSDENFLLFSPLLHEVAMGGVETRHIAYPIRRLHWRDRFNFVQASVGKIDLKNRKVVTTMGTLDFDYLVLSLGSVTNMAGLGSMERSVFTLKTLRDSIVIRNHIIRLFEQASVEKDPEMQRQLLTFVVSGAGYTGVQLVTEMRDFLYRGLLKFYKTIDRDKIRVILVEAEPKIISELHPKLGAYVMKHLRKSGIEVRLKSKVTGVWEDHIEINSAEVLPANTLIWVAGVIANPRIAEMDVEKDNLGRVFVDGYLELPGVPGVYAVGDCAHFEDPKTGQAIPPRAHIAVRQAKVVAHNILAEIRGRDKRLYRYSNTAEVISLGTSSAVARLYNLRLYGLPARMVWLAGYSLLAIGLYNRIRIITDWLLARMFGRDTTFIRLPK